MTTTEPPASRFKCLAYPDADACVYPQGYRVHADFFEPCSYLNENVALQTPNAECEAAAAADGSSCLHSLLSYMCDRQCPPCGDPASAYRPCTSKCNTMQASCPTMVAKGCFERDEYSCLPDTCLLSSPTAANDATLQSFSEEDEDGEGEGEGDEGCGVVCIVLIVMGSLLCVLFIVCMVMCLSSGLNDSTTPPPTATPMRASSRRVSSRAGSTRGSQRRTVSSRQPSLRSSTSGSRRR